jgi:hypothetical protein
MPSCSRYVLRRDFPRRLVYRQAALALEVVKQPLGRDAAWILPAKKVVRPETCVIATSRYGRFGFDAMMFQEGLVLENGTAAARIMERLVRDGFAVSRPERSGA